MRLQLQLAKMKSSMDLTCLTNLSWHLPLLMAKKLMCITCNMRFVLNLTLV